MLVLFLTPQDEPIAISSNHVKWADPRKNKNGECCELYFHVNDKDEPTMRTVKGTLSEVIAKLNGSF